MAEDRAPQPCVHLTFVPKGEDAVPIGASRFGGDPDLPHDLEWPHDGSRALSFLLQLDMTEVGPHDPSGSLPRSGFLWFFWSGVSVDDPVVVDRTEFAVLYADVRRGSLGRYEPGDGRTRKLGPVASVDARAGFARPHDEQRAGYAAGRGHRLLGVAWKDHARMARECEMASIGGWREGDWRLFLQVDGADFESSAVSFPLGTPSRIDMLYFWIREHDLSVRRFDKGWLVPLER